MFPHLRKLAQAVCASIGTGFADAGYDSAFNRDLCGKQGGEPVIRRRGDAHGSGLGPVRHIVENANAWRLSNKRTSGSTEDTTDQQPSCRHCSPLLASTWSHIASQNRENGV